MDLSNEQQMRVIALNHACELTRIVSVATGARGPEDADKAAEVIVDRAKKFYTFLTGGAAS